MKSQQTLLPVALKQVGTMVMKSRVTGTAAEAVSAENHKLESA
jgi:hypothetical protein